MVTNNITKLSFHNVFNLFLEISIIRKVNACFNGNYLGLKRGQGVMTIKTRNEYLEQYYLV